MNYAEAVDFRNANLKVIGEFYLTADIKYLIIGTQDKLQEIITFMFKYDKSNEEALLLTGILESKELDVIILGNLRAPMPIYGSLKNYLTKP